MREIVLHNPCGPAAFTLSGQLWDWGACKPPLGQITSQEPPSADRDTSTTEREQTQLFFLNTKSLHVQQALRSFLALLQAEVQHQLSHGGDNMLSRWGCPWDHWLLFSQTPAFWLVWAELPVVLGSSFMSVFLTSVFDTFHFSIIKQKDHCWRAISKRQNKSKCLGLFSKASPDPHLLLQKNSRVGVSSSPYKIDAI